MKVTDLIAKVKIALDYDVTQTAVDGFDDGDTLDINGVIKSQIEPAARQLTIIAPEEYVKWHDRSKDTYTSPTGRTDSYATYTDNCVIIKMPEDVLRVGSAKLECWNRPLNDVVDEGSARYRQTCSEFSGIRPSATRPLMAVVSKGENLCVELWGCTQDEHDVDYCNIAQEPKINTVLSNEIIDIKTNMEQPLVYATAAMTAEVMKDTSKYETMMKIAEAMLGLTNKRNETTNTTE